MAVLTVNAQQAAAIAGIDAKMDDAFASGVEQAGPIPVLGPAQGFDKLPSTLKTAVKFIFQSAFAAMLKQTAGLSVTVTLAKTTAGGTNGSLTFTNGILTSKVDPT